MATTFHALQASDTSFEPPVQPWRLQCARLTARVAAIVGVPGLDWIAGFRRVYPSIEAARSAAATYLPFDHAHPDNVSLHLKLAERLRPSDYPVLYHLSRIPKIAALFDLGGNVGNLYYSYRRHMPLLNQVRWMVYDIPFVTSLGEAIAADRFAANLNFVTSLSRLGDADVLLASGSIHYFEDSIPKMLEHQDCRPRHVLINRAPLLPDRSTCTVQDAGTFLAACKLHSKDALVAGMELLGYELADQWLVSELSLIIPCHPELSAYCYSGLYFRLRQGTQIR